MKLHKYFIKYSIKPLIDFRGYERASGYLYTKYSGLRGGEHWVDVTPPRVNPLGGHAWGALWY